MVLQSVLDRIIKKIIFLYIVDTWKEFVIALEKMLDIIGNVIKNMDIFLI